MGRVIDSWAEVRGSRPPGRHGTVDPPRRTPDPCQEAEPDDRRDTELRPEPAHPPARPPDRAERDEGGGTRVGRPAGHERVAGEAAQALRRPAPGPRRQTDGA